MERTSGQSKSLLQRLGRVTSNAARRLTPDAVHKLRTTIRRVEVLLAGSELSEKEKLKAEKMLKKIRRRAGKLRDLDVQATALASVNIRREERLKADLLAELAAARRKREKKLLAKLTPELRGRMRKRLSSLPGKQASTAHSDASVALALTDGLRLEWAQKPPEKIQDLHRFRIGCKRARYAFELASGFAQAEEFIQTLKAMQDAIGEAHDWAVLCETVNQRATPASPLLAAVRTITAAKLDDARRLCAKKIAQLAAMLAGKRTPQSAESAKKATRGAHGGPAVA